MSWSQVVIFGVPLVLAVWVLSRRTGPGARAGMKLGFLAFIAATLYGLARPDDLTVVANLFGIRRGADLLLYGLFMAFVFVTVQVYLHTREMEDRFTQLARRVALLSAVRPEDPAPELEPGPELESQPHGTRTAAGTDGAQQGTGAQPPPGSRRST